MTVPALRQRPQPFKAPGHGRLRDAYLAVLDGSKPADRAGLALAFAVVTLETLARHSLSPTQTEMAAGVADIGREHIPTRILSRLRKAGFSI